MNGAMNGAYARGSAAEAATGALVAKNGTPLPPSGQYLQQQEEAERHATLDRAWRHYIGDLHGHVRQEPGQPDLNVLSNRASTIVDTGVDFLYGKTVILEVLKNGKPQPEAQKALEGCWGNDAKRMTLLSKLAQNGGIFGHVFAKIVPPGKQRASCRVVPLDPAQVTVVTAPDDCDTVLAYIIDYQQPDDRFARLSVGKRQIITRVDPDQDAEDFDEGLDPDSTWEISNWLRGPNNQWYQVGEPIPWEHPWAPVVDWQNLPLANLHWGASDIPPNVLHLNSVLNLTLTDINSIAKFHGFPWLYAQGVNPDTRLEIGPGKMLKFPSPDAKVSAVQAYGDLAGMLSFAADLRSDMDEQTRVPSVATGRIRDVPRVTSGVAFQMMYGPLLGKTAHKQRLYEEGHAELSLRMLALCGYGDGSGEDGWEVKTHWPSPLPTDDAATAQLALAAEQIGMSQHFICNLLATDYDEELEYRQQEQQNQLDAFARGQGLPQTPALPTNGAPAPTDQPPGNNGQQPPVNHPQAIATRQQAQAAAGKPVTPNGM